MEVVGEVVLFVVAMTEMVDVFVEVVTMVVVSVKRAAAEVVVQFVSSLPSGQSGSLSPSQTSFNLMHFDLSAHMKWPTPHVTLAVVDISDTCVGLMVVDGA